MIMDSVPKLDPINKAALQRHHTLSKRSNLSLLGTKKSSSLEAPNNTATENFLLKVRINALKNKVSSVDYTV